MKKKVLYIDMDGVLVDFDRMLKENNLEAKEDIDKYVDNTTGIFKDLKPLEGAIDAFNFLSKHFDIYILTTAPWKNISSLSDKREWVGKHLPGVADKRLIITHRKDLNKGEYLIDDRKAKGSDKFEGELIWFGPKGDYKNWGEVLKYLRTKEGI